MWSLYIFPLLLWTIRSLSNIDNVVFDSHLIPFDFGENLNWIQKCYENKLNKFRYFGMYVFESNLTFLSDRAKKFQLTLTINIKVCLNFNARSVFLCSEGFSPKTWYNQQYVSYSGNHIQHVRLKFNENILSPLDCNERAILLDEAFLRFFFGKTNTFFV